MDRAITAEEARKRSHENHDNILKGLVSEHRVIMQQKIENGIAYGNYSALIQSKTLRGRIGVIVCEEIVAYGKSLGYECGYEREPNGLYRITINW